MTSQLLCHLTLKIKISIHIMSSRIQILPTGVAASSAPVEGCKPPSAKATPSIFWTLLRNWQQTLLDVLLMHPSFSHLILDLQVVLLDLFDGCFALYSLASLFMVVTLRDRKSQVMCFLCVRFYSACTPTTFI